MLDNNAVDNKEFILSNLKVETLSSMTRIISQQLCKRFSVPQIPMALLNIFAKIGDALRMDKFNSKVLRKLTVDSDLSRYSNIHTTIGYYEETSFEKATDKILIVIAERNRRK